MNPLEPIQADEPEPPARVPVVASVIRRGDRYLVCQRPDHKRHGGLWEFPGGKVHEGETLQEAAARELKEELDVHLSAAAPEPRFRARDPGSSFEILFLDVEIRGEVRALEHQALGWFTAEELRRVPLAPSDGRFAETLG